MSAGVVERAEHAGRVQRAKKISAALASMLISPSGLLIPDPLKAALGDLAVLIIELAQVSHDKFDMSPYDFTDLVRKVDSLTLFQTPKEKSDG